MRAFGIVADGGAGGRRRPSRRRVMAVAKSVELGYCLLEEGKSAVDAVEATIVFLEDYPDFNAGTGSRLQLDGVPRMDASIMEGDRLRAGAVAAVENINNPIRAARAVMERTEHVMLVGEGARRFAVASGIEEGEVRTARRIEEWKRNLCKEHKHRQLFESIYGCETVGAVAIDRQGQVASGCSTGGAPFMLPGRVGDTPILGAGIYADSSIGGVSATGLGEDIVRVVLSKSVLELMEKGSSPRMALRMIMNRLEKVTGGRAGAIAIDGRGRVGVWHNTEFMSYAYRMSGRKVKMGAGVK